MTLAFFASGAAGLIFEMVWFYQASLVLGNTVWAASIVVSSFLGGLGLGNGLAGWRHAKIRSPLRTYTALELSVAASGLIVAYALPELSRVLAPALALVGSTFWLLAAARLAFAFLVLLVPATAMGATLPVLIAALSSDAVGLGRAFGWLYGWNTLGAVTGVLSAELILIQAFGVTGAAWSAAFLNVLAATIARSLVARQANETMQSGQPPLARSALNALCWRLLASAALAGGAFTALEVIWFRFLSMFVLTTTLPMSVMLASVLAGIGLGGLAASAISSRAPASLAGAAATAWFAACSVPLSYRLFGLLTIGTQIGDWRQVLWLAIVMTAPTAFLSGVLLTLIAESLGRQGIHRTEATGWLLLANTIGAMCGPLVAAFILLPRLGMERAFFALSVLYVAAGGLTVQAARSRSRDARRPWWFASVAGGVAVIVLVTFPFGLMTRNNDRVVGPYKTDGAEIIAAREGASESILLMERRWLGRPVYDRLVTNGFSMSGTSTTARRYMRYFAYWPMIVHAAPIRTALLVCYGVGVTARALMDIPSLQSIDVVETSADVVAMSDLIYSPADHPLRDSRVRLHVEDGRYFLQTAAQHYDMITGEPPPPRTPGAVDIFTREYFQLIHDHLAEGGIATYWVPVARPDPGTDVNTIIRGFCDVFADCSLWNGTPSDFMLVGTRQAAAPVASDHFRSPWHVSRLQAGLRDIGIEAPEQIGATFLADARYLRNLVAATPPLTDNFPQRLRPVRGRPSLSDPNYRADPAAMKQYETLLDPARAQKAFAASEFIRRLWPPDLVPATLPFFEYQRILNRILWEGANPLAEIEDLHLLLTRSSLETIPLWLLGSDDVIQGIAMSSGESGAVIEYVQALGALARRDYADAVSRLERAAVPGAQRSTARALLVYALCLDDRIESARAQATGVSIGTPDERHFWTWMGSTFDVGPLRGRDVW